jgi:hypothetical protein
LVGTHQVQEGIDRQIVAKYARRFEAEDASAAA